MNKLETLVYLLRKLNPNDIKIIVYCDHSTRSVGELTKIVGIAQNNLIKRLKILKSEKRLKIEYGVKGKKTWVSIPDNIDPVFINSCHILFSLINASENYETGSTGTISLSESDSKNIFEILQRSDNQELDIRTKLKDLTKKLLKESSKL